LFRYFIHRCPYITVANGNLFLEINDTQYIETLDKIVKNGFTDIDNLQSEKMSICIYCKSKDFIFMLNGFPRDNILQDVKEKIENMETCNKVELQEETNDTVHKNDENNDNAFIKTLSERIVGTYGGFNVLLKNGRFGKYIVWGKNGEQRKSIEKTHLRSLNLSTISLDEVIRVIENDLDDGIDTTTASTVGEGIIRVINDDVSIRSGKYGNYIFYKTMRMKKPKFISLKNFQKNIHTCSEGDILSLL
jgi:hypothetical protein